MNDFIEYYLTKLETYIDKKRGRKIAAMFVGSVLLFLLAYIFDQNFFIEYSIIIDTKVSTAIDNIFAWIFRVIAIILCIAAIAILIFTKGSKHPPHYINSARRNKPLPPD